MTVRGAALLGVGAMVGAGIFALLGEAGAVAGAATWVSFLLAGIVSVLIGYNVVASRLRWYRSQLEDFALEFINLAERNFT